MGTRSITIVKENNKKLVVMYRQLDGYPSGHGQDLADFLRGLEIVNGIPLAGSDAPIANGMGCLSAMLVLHFKDGPGGIYLRPVSEASVKDQDYTYTLSEPDPNGPDYYTGPADNLLLTVHCWKKRIFKGTVAEFRQALSDPAGPLKE